MGIPYISAYAFSTENWKRSPSEVSFIMRFSTEVLNRQLETLKSWGVRIRWAGRRPKLWKTSSHNSNNANAKLSITPPAPSLCASTMEDAQKSQTQPQLLHKTYKQASSNPPLSQKKLSKNTSTNQTYQTLTFSSDHQANNEYPTSSSGKAPTPNSSS